MKKIELARLASYTKKEKNFIDYKINVATAQSQR